MSATQPVEERQALKEFVQTHSQIGQLAQLEAVLDQGEAIAGIARVRAAQEAAAIRQLNPNAPATPENEMRTIVFGDMIQQPPPAPPSKPALGTLAKLGMAAALLATGVGAGVAIPLALEALRPRPVASPPGTNTTIERDYQIGDVTVE